MDLALALLQGASFLAVAAALVYAPLTRIACAVTLLAALLGLGLGLAEPGVRELQTTHTFVAYEGQSLEPSAVHFPTGTKSAPGWQWPLPFLGFAALWTVLLLAVRNQEEQNAWILPLVFGWSATATWLAMQWFAAPAMLVQPFALDRFLWPAGLALALRLAASTERLAALFLKLGLGCTLLRLPAALFSKYASDARLGTSLDISSITTVVHPVQRMQVELAQGSSEQQMWLIWAENVFALPAFHFMSVFGFAFAVWLMSRHTGGKG
jgi:hypothetical protein